MADLSNIRICDGFPPDQRAQAARLFWEAFGPKLRLCLGPDAKALAYIERVLSPEHAIAAIGPDGALIGIAGFKTDRGAFVGGGLKDLQTVYGAIGGLARAMPLGLIDRPLEPGVLTMDGVMVSADARGLGVGTALLAAVKAKAAALGRAQVRLDVIDANPRARALYERQGFVAHESVNLGLLRFIFGFRRSTRMVFTL